jgi:drug/metabolite transporter (DMT)-like permease
VTAVLLGLAAALSWGTSDFLGGLAGRRADRDISVAVGLWGQLIGLLGLGTAGLLLGGDALTSRDVAIGVGAGIGGSLGVVLLYRGLRIGRMGVVAPITGAGAAALPVLVSVARGESPSAVAWTGVAAALVAIVLVSREPAPVGDGAGPPHDGAFRGIATPGLLEAVGAGIGFGLIFVLLDLVGDGTGLRVFVPMKASASLFLVGLAVVTRQPAAPPRGTWWPVLGVGVLDNAANVAFVLATRSGLLAVAAVLSSLYPVATVVLARVVLGEHLARHQLGGLALAGAGIALIAAG